MRYTGWWPKWSKLARQPVAPVAWLRVKRHCRPVWAAQLQARQGSSSARREAAEAVESEFNVEFERQWGLRWPQLSAALAAPTRHVALLNPFLLRQLSQAELPGALPLAARHPQLASLLSSIAASGPVTAASPVQALHWDPPGTAAGNGSGNSSSITYPQPPTDPVTGLTAWYWMDAASLVPPLLLDVQPGQAVLDMCAAPGGKSFVLSQLLFAAEHAAAAAAAAGSESTPSSSSSDRQGSGGSSSGGGSGHSSNAITSASKNSNLVCNELDSSRRARLVRVLRSYVPEPVRQRHIRVTPHDGARWWGRQEAESFDRVLLDAPCSSDRHVAQQAAARGSSHVPRSDWSAQRCRRIAGTQAKLLEAGVKALRPGGRLVYSTCSIAELENDGVVERMLEKAQGSLAVASHTLSSLGGGSAAAAGMAPHAAAAGAKAAAGEAGAASIAARTDAKLATLDGLAERTRHGWLLLPDAAGCGPIYLCVIQKLASTDLRRVRVNKYARTS